MQIIKCRESNWFASRSIRAQALSRICIGGLNVCAPVSARNPSALTGSTDHRQLLARVAHDAAGMKELARKEALAQEPGLCLSVRTMEAVFGEASNINSARIASELEIALGSLALLLATLGLYGVMAFSVAQRTREIGVRMALGAQAGQVQMQVIAQGMRLVLIGVLIGVPISMAASRVMKSMLFGLSLKDPATYVGVVALLAITGFIACWGPRDRRRRWTRWLHYDVNRRHP
jgi:putative ABC transport system permease protein